MDLDQVELDAAYDQEFYAPLGRQITARRASNSVAFRSRFGDPRRVSYGPTEVEKLDIYRTKRPNAPIFVFIHGGAWLGGEAKNSGDSAELSQMPARITSRSTSLPFVRQAAICA
jgi:arylformamidase